MTVTLEPSTSESWPLVERAQQGDRAAFGELYGRYQDAVHRFILFRVGNKTLAEDLTSETFTKALRSIGTVTWQGRDIGAWLITIARNLVTDHYKSHRVRREVTVADVADGVDSDQVAPDSPEKSVVDYLTNRALAAAVLQLTGDQRRVIELRFYQGLSVAEAAEVFGRDIAAIKALQFRAVRALHRLIASPAPAVPVVPARPKPVGYLDPAEVRRWAALNNISVSPFGRISLRVEAAYRDAVGSC